MSDDIRILLADDQDMVRRGIRTLLDSVDGLDVVAEAADGEEAVTMAAAYHPDLVIMDISMPRMDGFEAAAQIRDRMLSDHIVFLTMYNSPSLARKALKIGARGYVLKRKATEELLAAVRLVAQGKTFLSKSLQLETEDENYV